jgi:hypothetical protein
MCRVKPYGGGIPKLDNCSRCKVVPAPKIGGNGHIIIPSFSLKKDIHGYKVASKIDLGAFFKCFTAQMKCPRKQFPKEYNFL